MLPQGLSVNAGNIHDTIVSVLIFSDSTALTKLLIQLRVAETPVYLRSLESKSVLGEGQSLYDIALALIFERGLNPMSGQLVNKLAPGASSGQHIFDSMAYLILDLVFSLEPVRTHSVLAFPEIQSVFLFHFLADRDIPDTVVPVAYCPAVIVYPIINYMDMRMLLVMMTGYNVLGILYAHLFHILSGKQDHHTVRKPVMICGLPT